MSAETLDPVPAPVVGPYDRVTRAGLTRIARSVLGPNARLWRRETPHPMRVEETQDGVRIVPAGHTTLWQLGIEVGATKRVLCEAPNVRELAERFLVPVRDYAAGLRPPRQDAREGPQSAPGTTIAPEPAP